MPEQKNNIADKQLRKAVLKACKSVEKMMREEPHLVVISDGGTGDSNSTSKEITSWLFHRSHSDGSERNANSN